ncbi:MAG: diacylglycerol kinase family protein [Actinomycetota bacterium]|nr:diacylglycerol kinase family protein [Actinomycetota bacterium]
MRALLIVNPQATTTSRRMTDLVIHAFADALQLEVATTEHRGHGIELGRQAREADLDVVITVGGDGIINEVVNGLITGGAAPRTQLATLPGGSANVFARALGIPNDLVEAGAHLLEGIKQGRKRTIGLGRANDRWFTVNAGVGLDAEVIAAMEHKRRRGRKASPSRYLTTMAATMIKSARNRVPQLTLTRGELVVQDVYLSLVQNTAPWTYLGNWPIQMCPAADFNGGLDLFALRKIDVPTALQSTRRLLVQRTPSALSSVIAWHDEQEFRISALKPMAFQIDGEGMGEVTEVRFSSEPAALTVVV